MLLGIDVGTTNVKVVLVEELTFRVLHKQSQPLGELETVRDPRAAERSVSQIFQALESCMSRLESSTERLEEVRAIGVCGQMHGCVLWKSSGEPLFNEQTGALQHNSAVSSNLITWQDGRCDPAFISSLPKPPYHTKPSVSTGYGCATLSWLHRHNSKTLAHYDRAGTIMDMVVCALCSGGNSEVMMSSQNAASWGYFDQSSSQWHREILDGLFPLYLLPGIVSVPSTAGYLKAAWHQIPRGTKIGVAMGDLQCSVYAAQPCLSDAVLNMGSASQLVLIKPPSTPGRQPPLSIPQSVQEVPYFSGDCLLVAAALGGGNTISLFVNTLQSWLRELGSGSNPVSLDFQEMYTKVMQSAAEKIDTTLQVDPRVWGERHTPEMRGLVGNVGPDNISLGDVGSAIVRGVVENLHAMMSPHLLELCQVERVLGSGKTLQNHGVFREHIQRVFKLPLVLKVEADAPLGAAMAVANL